MKFQKNILLTFTLGTSLLSLGACTGLGHPNAMPSGYTHHHATYKSPVSAPSSKVTVEQRHYMNADQAEDFRDAVYDLLERVTMRAGLPPKPVYILAPDPMTTFYANIDNDLRESMRHIGYAISDTPAGAYIFTYEALPIHYKEHPSRSMHENVKLTLRVFNGMGEGAQQLTEEFGLYFIQGAETLNIAPSQYSNTERNYNVRPIPSLPIEPLTAVPSLADPTVVPPVLAIAPPTPIVNSVPAPAPVVIERPAISTPDASLPSASSRNWARPQPVVTESPAISLPDRPVPSLTPTVPVPHSSSVIRQPIAPVPEVVPSTPLPRQSIAIEPVAPSVPTQVRVPNPAKVSQPPPIITNQRDALSTPATIEVEVPEKLTTRTPSRDDIVIINRGDKPSVAVDIVQPPNVLERAVPTSENIIRRRVSNPTDY